MKGKLFNTKLYRGLVVEKPENRYEPKIELLAGGHATIESFLDKAFLVCF